MGFTVPPKQITLYTVTTHKSGIVADNLKLLIFMFAVYVYDNLNMHLQMCLVLYSVGCICRGILEVILLNSSAEWSNTSYGGQ